MFVSVASYNMPLYYSLLTIMCVGVNLSIYCDGCGEMNYLSSFFVCGYHVSCIVWMSFSIR
jgi:hypothetical protein